MKMPTVLTALVTPFRRSGAIALDVFYKICAWQIHQGKGEIGLVPAGTTGEASTLDEKEHVDVIKVALGHDIFILAGAGSNNPKEADYYVGQTAKLGGKAVLLVDPYYLKVPSSQIARRYLAPIAEAFPDMAIVPYIIPGRTAGTGLSPRHLAELVKKYPNIIGVKDATGDPERTAETRRLVGLDFPIFSGDDGATFKLMTRPDIKACGVISVISNIAPAAVLALCKAILAEDYVKAEKLNKALKPLFDVVTVTPPYTDDNKEIYPNPEPIKTMMEGIGMDVGPCRPTLDYMPAPAVQKVRLALKEVWENNPEILQPVADFFGPHLSIDQRLADNSVWEEIACKD